jgi:8-amino-7-oxononanoate synthase
MRVQQALQARERDHNRRRLMPADGSGVDFTSNDYLSLRADAAVKTAFAEAAQRYGLGAGAAHLLGGHHEEHIALADALSSWTNRACAGLFASGFQAAIGIISALIDSKDLVFADRLIHACMIDACRQAQAPLRRFQHHDVRHAQALLQQPSARAAPLRWLLLESLYSMDGDSPDIDAFCQLARSEKACIMLDEAHALGVLGPQGSGAMHARHEDVVAAQMLTFGKALGSSGAAIMGAPWLADVLANFSRAFIYTTAMPPANAAATRHCVALARTQQWRRDQLFAHIALWQRCCALHGVVLAHQYASPIQIVPMLQSARALAVKSSLAAQGFHVAAVRAPTVPKGQARLRITLNVAHTASQIEALAEQLARAIDALPAQPAPELPNAMC